jgi:hypothetical protein
MHIMPESSSVIQNYDVCQMCGSPVYTMAFKGTGACSDQHFKQIYGHARISEVIQARNALGHGDGNSAEERTGDATSSGRRVSDNGRSRDN